jgi:hypothetical protein
VAPAGALEHRGETDPIENAIAEQRHHRIAANEIGAENQSLGCACPTESSNPIPCASVNVRARAAPGASIRVKRA